MWSKIRLWALLVALTAFIGTVEDGLAQGEIKPPGRRIVGGEKTDIKEHPWQVGLQFRGTFFCGGSIIAQKWILTAAHCFKYSASSGDWRAKAGATNHATMGVWSQIERVVVHQEYDPKTYANDIALIKLKSPPTGRVIALAKASLMVPVGQPLEVTGWGKTETGVGSAVLLKASVPYVETAVCNEQQSYNGRIRPGMICAGHREGHVDSCNGDSGGPLVWRHPEGPILVGVVSWGDGCAEQLKYGVYTSVSSFRPWIDRILAADRN